MELLHVSLAWINPWWDIGDGTTASMQKDEEKRPNGLNFNTFLKTEYTQRADVWGVSTVLIRLKAKTIATKMKMDGSAGGPSWCLRSMSQTNLSKTTLCQQLPPNCEEKFGNFHKFTQTKIWQDGSVIYVKKGGSDSSLLQCCQWYWGRHLHLIVECGLYTIFSWL